MPAVAAEDESLKIRIISADIAFTVTLDDNDTARDLRRRLPMELELEDYAATVKIARLTPPLSTKGAPDGHTPAAGDLAWYAPLGNLAIFHKGFRYSPQLVRLGRVE